MHRLCVNSMPLYTRELSISRFSYPWRFLEQALDYYWGITDWRQKNGTTEDEIVGWHHQLDGHELQQALVVGDGQRSLACCSVWDQKELDMTEQLNWTVSVYVICTEAHYLYMCIYIYIYIYIYTCVYKWVIIIQSCLILYNTMDCSPPGSFVHWILDTRILECVAISLSNICAYIYTHIYINI